MATTSHASFAVALFALSTAFAHVPAEAQSFPSRPLKIVVPFPAGGNNDNVSRLVAQKLSEAYKQSVIVENRPGAGGVVGSEQVAKATPDGYTLVLSSLASHVIAPIVQKIHYDGQRDFTHIAILGGSPTMLVVGPALADVKDLKAFVALAKAKPNTIGYGTPGNGTHGHLVAERLRQLAGIDIVHVPYKGTAPAVTDLVAGHLPAVSLPVASMGAYLRAGKLRGLASTSAKRTPDFADIPTYAELGYPDLTGNTWSGIAGPARMPEAIVQSLNREIRRALQAADVREKLAPEGFDIADFDATQTNEFVRSETRRWQPIAKSSSARNE